MAHDLETWGGGRSASFVSARQHAWHRLGTVLPAEFDAAEAERLAAMVGLIVETLRTNCITRNNPKSAHRRHVPPQRIGQAPR